MRSTLLAMVAVTSLWAEPSGLPAQEVTLDEGTFTIYEGSTEVGTETFSIRQSGSGAELRVVAGARIHIVAGSQPRDVQTTLELRGPEGRVVLYAVKVGGAEPQDVRYTEDGPSRLSMVRRTEVGERAREMRAPPGLTVLDAGVVHHLYFLKNRIQGGEARIPVLVPIAGETGEVNVRDRGQASIQVGSTTVQARHLEVTSPTGGTLSAWFDDRGRLLQVARSADVGTAFRAVRTQLP